MHSLLIFPYQIQNLLIYLIPKPLKMFIIDFKDLYNLILMIYIKLFIIPNIPI